MALFSVSGSGTGIINTLAATQVDTGLTLCVWARYDGGASSWSCIAAFDESGNPTADYLFIETNSDRTTWELWVSANFFSASTQIASITNDEWIFIAIVRNATDDTDIYYRREGESTLTAANWTDDAGGFTGDELQIGTDGFDEYFSGDIHGVKLYERALTAAEVLSESNRTRPFSTQDLTALHPLVQQVAGYAVDYSPVRGSVAAAPLAASPTEGGSPPVIRAPQHNPLRVAPLTITVEDQRVAQGKAFRYRPNLSGGTGSYSLSVVVGSLPSGLTASGEIVSGTTNAAAGDTTVTLRVTSGSETADASWTVKVIAAPAFTTQERTPVFVVLGDRDAIGNLGALWLGFREYDTFQFATYIWNDASSTGGDPGFDPTKWQPYLPSVNSNTGEFGGVWGPDLGFLEIVRKDPELSGRDIYIVKTPKPGPVFDDGGNWSWTHDAGYHYAFAKFLQAIEGMKAIGLRPDVRGVFVLTGRLDGGSQAMSDAYPANLRTLIEDALTDYAPYALSDGVPRVFVGRSPPSGSPPPHIGAIQAAVDELTQTDSRLRAVHYDQCQFNGLAGDPDNLSAVGMVGLGWRMAWAWRVPLEDVFFLACLTEDVLAEFWWSGRGQGAVERSILTKLLPQRMRGDGIFRQFLEVLLTRCRQAVEREQWADDAIDPTWRVAAAGGIDSESVVPNDLVVGGASAGIFAKSVPSASFVPTDHRVGVVTISIANGVPSGSFVPGSADGLEVETTGVITGAGGVGSGNAIPTDHSVSAEAPDFGEAD